MKNNIQIRIVLFFIILISFVSADIISINSGGGEDIAITSNQELEGFFFSYNNLPEVFNVLLSSISGMNSTNDNLTVAYSVRDDDSDVVYNITDWRLDGDSIAVLNLAFNTRKIKGMVRDYSSYGNNGTLGNGVLSRIPNWTSGGIVGGAYEFDGVDDVIYAPHSGSNEITLAMWVKRNNLDYSRSTKKGGGAGAGQFIMVFSGDEFGVYLGSGTPSPGYHFTTDGGISQDTWEFITWSYNGSSLKLYVNGEFNTEVEVTRATSFDNYDIRIGEEYGSGDETFNGSIDEFKVYNLVLSSEQINAIYQDELVGHAPNTLVSQETSKDDVWQVAVTPNDLIGDGVTVLSNSLSIDNLNPDNPNPLLESLDGSNESDVDLNCSFLVSDVDDSILDVSVNWSLDGIEQFVINYPSILNGTMFGATLEEGNLTLGDVWMCSAQISDSGTSSNWGDSNILEIIDITNPVVFIVSPNETNYSFVEINFNVSVVENENVFGCFYEIDLLGNLSLDRLNDSYFWTINSTLSPGEHNVTFYCNDTSGNWGSNSTNFTILDEAAISILLSDELLWGVKWNVFFLPSYDLDANGNNLNTSTDYMINISATNTLVDLYVKADGDLYTDTLDVLGLGNETYSVNLTDVTVPWGNRTTMTTNYTLIGEDLTDESVVYMKFYLDAPGSQPSGIYENALQFKAVPAGEVI